MSKQHRAALNDILDLINDWQMNGRSGFCLPVISGKQLEGLEELADERRRDKCQWCHSSGMVDYMICPHCRPLAGT